MFPSNPINDPTWLPHSSSSFPSVPTTDPTTTTAPLKSTLSNPEGSIAKKRIGPSSLLDNLTKRFSRKKSAPAPPKISKVEIWKATSSNSVHPNAARLGMNTFNFGTGGSRDGRKGKVVERELSPGAPVLHRRGNGSELSLIGDGFAASRSSSKKSFFDTESELDDEEDERGRHRSGTSAYSEAARKRASGYVPKKSPSSPSPSPSSSFLKKKREASLKNNREPSYGSAQLAHFTSAYPRQIDTRNSNVSGGSSNIMRSPTSSMGSGSIQRNGSSIWDRSNSSSRWDSIATDITTPDLHDHRKSSYMSSPTKKEAPRRSLFDRRTGASSSVLGSTIVSSPEKLRLLIPSSDNDDVDDNDDDASIETATEEEINNPPGEEEGRGSYPHPITTLSSKEKEQAKGITFSANGIPPPPFIVSDLQTHQIRVQDFGSQPPIHEVRNAMDMAFSCCPDFPRKHRKSVFLEMEDDRDDDEDEEEGLCMPVSLPHRQKQSKNAGEEKEKEKETTSWEETLKHLSLTAVNGNVEFYSRNGSSSPPISPSSTLPSVAEEGEGTAGATSWAFGHKRSIDDDGISPSSTTLLEACGEFPLHERAGEGSISNSSNSTQTVGEGSGGKHFRPGHRRSRAISLGRPKTIYVIPESSSPGSMRGEGVSNGGYEMQDAELDEAVARDCQAVDEVGRDHGGEFAVRGDCGLEIVMEEERGGDETT